MYSSGCISLRRLCITMSYPTLPELHVVLPHRLICHSVNDEVHGTVQYDQHLEDLANDVGHIFDGDDVFESQ